MCAHLCFVQTQTPQGEVCACLALLMCSHLYTFYMLACQAPLWVTVAVMAAGVPWQNVRVIANSCRGAWPGGQVA